MHWGKAKEALSSFDLSIYQVQFRHRPKTMRQGWHRSLGRGELIVHQWCNGVVTVHLIRLCYWIPRRALLAIVAWIAHRRSYRPPYLYTIVSRTPAHALLRSLPPHYPLKTASPQETWPLLSSSTPTSTRIRLAHTVTSKRCSAVPL